LKKKKRFNALSKPKQVKARYELAFDNQRIQKSVNAIYKFAFNNQHINYFLRLVFTN